MTKRSIQFESKGRAYEVTSACDLMVCFMQARREAAEETLEEIRAKNKSGELEDWKAYKMERMTAKLLDFYKTKEKLISLYAEAKQNNGELARLLEDENKELVSFYEGTEKAFEKLSEETA